MFEAIWTAIKAGASALWGDVRTAAVATEPAIVTAFDALVDKYKPAAITLAQQAENGVEGVVTGAEKASYVKSQLSETVQADGLGVEQDGFDAFLNLLVEFGANFVKVLTGIQLTVPPAA